jgi:hypothetical protein
VYCCQQEHANLPSALPRRPRPRITRHACSVPCTVVHGTHPPAHRAHWPGGRPDSASPGKSDQVTLGPPTCAPSAPSHLFSLACGACLRKQERVPESSRSARFAVPTHAPRRASPQLTSPSTSPSQDHPTHAPNTRRLHAPLTPPSLSSADLQYPLSLILSPRRRSAHHANPVRPREPRPRTFSSVYARTPRTSIPLPRRDAPSSARIGLRCLAAVAEPFLTAKRVFLCHHHQPPVKPLTPLRTPVRCRPFQPSGAIQQPSRHATQARRGIRHLNLSPPTTTSNADVIA